MPSDYLPPYSKPAFCEWLENLKLEFPMVASLLGFSAAEITAILNDLNWALYVCRSTADASSYGRAWTEFRDGLLTGDPNSPVSAQPTASGPAPPAALPPVRGIIARLRAMVKRTKTSPAYTQSIGESLRIVASPTPIDPATAKPKVKVRPLTMFQSEVIWVAQGFTAVKAQSQRNGGQDWDDMGPKMGSRFVDDRPPVEPGKPEVRSYRLLYLRDNAPVGQWSDVVTVTVQP